MVKGWRGADHNGRENYVSAPPPPDLSSLSPFPSPFFHLSSQPSLFFSAPVAPEECAVYTNGTAKLSLCIESVSKPSGSIQVVRATHCHTQ